MESTRNPAAPAFPRETLVFLALTVLQVVPLFFLPYFPNSDGPAHAANAVLLNRYHGPEGALYRQYVTLRDVPPPNMAGHLILAGLVRFVPASLADKILAAILMVAFPWVVRRALAAWSPEYRPYSYAALPFATGWFVHMGFQNFLLSVIFLFVALEIWLRRSESWKLRSLLLFSVVILLVYFSHVVGLVLLFATLGVLILGRAISTARTPVFSAKVLLVELWRRAGPVTLAALPAGVLTLHYLVTNARSGNGGRLPLVLRLGYLATTGGSIPCYSKMELIFSVPVGLLIAALAVRSLVAAWKGRCSPFDPRFFFLVLACTGIYMIAPEAMAGGFFLTRRLSLFPILFLLFCAAQVPLQGRLRWAVPASWTVCALALVVLRLPTERAFSRDLVEYVSAESALRSDSTFIPLSFIEQGEGLGGTAISKHTWPLDTAADYLMARNGRLNLAHYESAASGFMTRFRPELDPSQWIGSGLGWAWTVPPKCDFLTYASRTAGRVDYVLLWGRRVASREVLESEAARSVLRQLDEGYRPVFASSPRGLMEVYERKN